MSMERIIKFYNSIINILLPNTCINCHASIESKLFLCKKCINKLPFNKSPICIRCGRSLKNQSFQKECYHCKDKNYSFERSYSVFQYKEPIIELIYHLKYKNFKNIKFFLLEHLGEFLNFYDIIEKHNISIISSVPLHQSKLRERGYNQSQIIAQAIAETVSLPYKETLIATKYKKSQTRIKHLNRQDKVKGVFKAIGSTYGNVLLIDDVFTTGSTLNECACLLKENGAGKVIALTICSTPK